MNNPVHWSENDLLDKLYGLETRVELSESHLGECPACSAAWQSVSAKRAELMSAPPPPISDERLRLQRQAIWTKIERPPTSLVRRMAPAMATALMLVVGVALNQMPDPQPPVQQIAQQTISDEQLFTEIASAVNQDSPRATDSIRGLFAEGSSAEAQ